MNITEGNIEELLSSATKNGMYLVNESNTDALEKEYDEGIILVDKLCEVSDPETAPFESKYKARKLLDDLCNKLEATKTIASLEQKREIITLMSRKLASARVRLGTISWECEEPHSAQTDLEFAADHYFSGFIQNVCDMVGSDPDHEDSEEGDNKVQSLLSEELVPPIINITINDDLVDAMKCLNMLGILWAGRGQVRKSLLYLLSVKNMYQGAVESSYDRSLLKKTFLAEIDSIYTHNLFYLAQAYGNIGNSQKSSVYCKETLQRQLNAGLHNSITGTFDWVKNCASISDFYQSMGDYRHCGIALASAEKILKIVFKKLKESKDENNEFFGVSENEAFELQAEINKKFVKLDGIVLKMAVDAINAKKEAMLSGDVWTPPIAEDETDIEINSDDVIVVEDINSDGVVEQSTQETSLPPLGMQVSLFSGCTVDDISYLRFGEIDLFDKARRLFLRATARIEDAKKIFLLDGFVTDHVFLLQEQSKLYHYLAGFELDAKRKIAMEGRRLEILLPLLSTLNRTAFEALHKQISYELGEVYLGLLDIKLDKLREKSNGVIEPSKLKKTELLKCNTYCKGVFAMFSHFTNMYAASDKRLDTKFKIDEFDNFSIQELVAAGCIKPDESLISGDEIRPFLNAHFLCCRALSKVMVPPPDTLKLGSGAEYLVLSLKKHEWLMEFGTSICVRKGIDLNNVFQAETQICKDMVELLPGKIDRMHFRGEGGLTL